MSQFLAQIVYNLMPLRWWALRPGLLKLIITDSHFWVPAVVLILGVLLLVYLH
jgi:hypothetical protein